MNPLEKICPQLIPINRELKRLTESLKTAPDTEIDGIVQNIIWVQKKRNIIIELNNLNIYNG